MTKVLLVDDDPALRELLGSFLKSEGFQVQSAVDGKQGLSAIEIFKPHLIILDVILPDLDGIAVLKEIRKNRELPVIMLTAKGNVIDRVVGLELGADDYLAKPFEPRELTARIRAVLKRISRNDNENIISGDIVIDPQARNVVVRGHKLDLTTMEYDLILLFVNNPGRKFTRDEILSCLHDQEVDSFGRAIDALVNRVRRKLEKTTSADLIQTVWGTGYMYVESKKES